VAPTLDTTTTTGADIVAALLMALLLLLGVAEVPAEVGKGSCVKAAVLDRERVAGVEMLVLPAAAEEAGGEDKPADMEDATFGLVLVLLLIPGWVVWLLLPGATTALLEAEAAAFTEEEILSMLDANMLGTPAQVP